MKETSHFFTSTVLSQVQYIIGVNDAGQKSLLCRDNLLFILGQESLEKTFKDGFGSDCKPYAMFFNKDEGLRYFYSLPHPINTGKTPLSRNQQHSNNYGKRSRRYRN